MNTDELTIKAFADTWSDMIAEIGLDATICDIINTNGEHGREGLIRDLASADVSEVDATEAINRLVAKGELRELGDGMLAVARDN